MVTSTLLILEAVFLVPCVLNYRRSSPLKSLPLRNMDTPLPAYLPGLILSRMVLS
ncbi:hypothetical protein BMETH_2330_1 [methanotrophic bacterial endosymbiont of Bathymodiolus sp.]|nr:hypothetical protein BMETH_2330_1 [methanotrophic bacterial endosymbiont of Bathymodiolus sp.]